MTSPIYAARLGIKFSTIVFSFAVFILTTAQGYSRHRLSCSPFTPAPRGSPALQTCPLRFLIGSMPLYVDIPLEGLDTETCTVGGGFIRWALVQARGIWSPQPTTGFSISCAHIVYINTLVAHSPMLSRQSSAQGSRHGYVVIVPTMRRLISSTTLTQAAMAYIVRPRS